jgi:hypothetical protein
MYRLHLLLAGMLTLGVPMIAQSSWGVGGCFLPAQGPVGPAQPAEQIGSPLRWVRNPDATQQAALYRGMQQIGAWDADSQKYRMLIDFDRNIWGPEMDTAPIPPPADLVRAPRGPIEKKLEPWQVTGVNVGEMCRHERYSINGTNVSYAEMKQSVEDGLIDDSPKLFLSVWSKDAAKRAAVVEDLKKNPDLWQWVQTRCHLWAGEAATPDHFLTKDREGKPLYCFDGDPCVMLQDANGVELWHDAGYKDGPPSLEKMRKQDPQYRPDNSPGPRAPGGGSGNYFGYLLLGAGLLGLIVWGTASRKDS